MAVNTLLHTVRVDIGHVNGDGVNQPLEDVRYTAQTPPAIGGTALLEYSNDSVHSIRIGASSEAGQSIPNSQIISAANVVNSVKKTGESDGQTGDLELEAGTNMDITRTGKRFTFNALGGAAPTEYGQIMASLDGAVWSAALPMVSDDGFILVDDLGHIVFAG